MFIIDKKQKFLIIIFILAILITGLILYFRYFLKQTPANNVFIPENIVPIKSEDLEIFNDPLFKDLEIPKKALDDLGPIGRDNPFAPY